MPTHNTSLADISLGAVPFSLQGMNKLSNILIPTFIVTEGTADTSKLRMSATMTNPSSVYLDMGRIGFNMTLSRTPVGYVEGELSLKPGTNTFVGTTCGPTSATKADYHLRHKSTTLAWELWHSPYSMLCRVQLTGELYKLEAMTQTLLSSYEQAKDSTVLVCQFTNSTLAN